LDFVPSFAAIPQDILLSNKQNRQPVKRPDLSSCSSALVLSASLFAAAFPAAGQSILINMNEANPSAVQFITTGANSFAASSVMSPVENLQQFLQ